MDDVVIAPDSPRQSDVSRLVRDLDTYLGTLYPAENNHLVDIEALCAPDVRFLVARIDGFAVGCGAIVLKPGYAEIKRMFVHPSMRGRKVGGRLLQRLELQAAAEGITMLRLETGVRQDAAIALYRAAGYRERAPFGDYKPDPLSLFMEKVISA